MAHVAPDGGVYQAGTLSGHPLTMAAGVATLRPADARRLRAPRGDAARRSRRGSATRRADAGREVAIARVGSLLTVFFRAGRAARLGGGAGPPTATRTPGSSARCSTRACSCRRRQFEAWFIGACPRRRRGRRRRSRPRGWRSPRDAPSRCGVTGRRRSRRHPVPTPATSGRPRPARRHDAGLVHAPGRPRAARVPRDPRAGHAARDHPRRRAVRRGHAPARPPARRRRRDPVRRHHDAARGPRASRSTSSRASGRSSSGRSAPPPTSRRFRPFEPEAAVAPLLEAIRARPRARRRCR